MAIITIPKKLINKGDLVIVPRKEYEELLDFRLKKIQEVELTPIQKRALVQAKKNLSKDKFLTIYDLKQKMGIAN